MAEVLGIVAGGIGIASFVVEIADSLIKLKDFAVSVKSAPEELKYLLQSVEDLNRILEDIGVRAQRFGFPDGENDIIDKSLVSCHRAAQDIHLVTKNLEEKILGGSQKARFKFAFQKQLLKGLRLRLEEAKQNVLLAHIASNM